MIDIKWKILRPNETIYELAEELEIPTEIASCYYNRGLTTKDKIVNFINTNLNNLYDPFLLPDMDKAVDRVCKAITNRELIHVHGDYDVDGITATAIMVFILLRLNANFTYYTPHRIEDGYDLQIKHIESAKKNGVDLLITVDCGIRATEALKYANQIGMDVIVTDHHLAPDDFLPSAYAIINTHRKDSNYPFVDLAGCGIAMKFAMAIGKKLGLGEEFIFDNLLDYVVLGTVADMAPLVDENRIIVSRGCDKLLCTKKVGLQKLLKVANIKDNVDTTSIGFYIGPRINAIGRLSDSMTALNLMLETNNDRAELLAKQLDTANKRRQQLQNKIYDEAVSLLPQDMSNTYVITVATKSWHPGIVGLVANRLTDTYGVPSMVGVIEGGIVHGSCRSTPNFPIIDAMRQYNDLFIKYGGHAYAAGFEITLGNFKKLEKLINDYAKDYFGGDYKPSKIISIDSLIRPEDVNENLYLHLVKLSPFGINNPEPIFAVKKVNIFDITIFGNGKYAKFKFKKHDNNRWVMGTWWKKNDERCKLENEMLVDIAFKIKSENWQGKTNYVAIVEDIRPSE